MDPVTGCADSASGTTQMSVGIAVVRSMPVRRGVIAVFPINPGHRSSLLCSPSLQTGANVRVKHASNSLTMVLVMLFLELRPALTRLIDSRWLSSLPRVRLISIMAAESDNTNDDRLR